MLREGSVMSVFNVADSDRLASPPSPCCEAFCSFMIAATSNVVVCSRVCKASVGAFGTYQIGRGIERSSMRRVSLTTWVPEFGSFTFPLVTASQICEPGTSWSVQRTVNKGESQRTIEEGSSYLMMRFSRLKIERRLVTMMNESVG